MRDRGAGQGSGFLSVWETKTEELALITTQLQGSAGLQSPSQFPAALHWDMDPILFPGQRGVCVNTAGPPSVALLLQRRVQAVGYSLDVSPFRSLGLSLAICTMECSDPFST